MKVFPFLVILLVVTNTCHGRNIWFDDISSPLTINKSQADGLFSYIRHPGNNEFPVNDISPRIVFLSHSKPFRTASIHMGRGPGLQAALDDALSTVTDDAIKENDWLKLDIVQFSSPAIDSTNNTGNYDVSLYGFALAAASNMAFLPEEISAFGLVNQDNSIDLDKLNAYLGSRNRAGSLVTNTDQVFRFMSQSFFHSDNTTIRLFRGHPVERTVTRQKLLSDSVNIGTYLSRNISTTGEFHYVYRADKDSYASSYNILRHAGAIASLLDIYKHTGQQDFLSPISRSMAYLVSHIKSCKPPFNPVQSSCVIHNNKIKLGANALTIIAIARYIELTGDRRYLDKIIQLGNWITRTQAPDGRFSVHKQYASSGKVSDFVSEYYPGEATLALIELYKLTKQESWLSGAISAANYIIQQQGRLPPDKLPHDHWFLYSLNALYRIKPDPAYLEHAKKLTDTIINKQNLKPAYEDWYGSYYIPPRSAPTATRTEGLIAAYRLFDYAHDAYKTRLAPHISHGISFLVNTLYSEPALMYLPRPDKAKYGVRRGLTSHEIRIDYCQHAISSFLGYLDILKIQNDSDGSGNLINQ